MAFEVFVGLGAEGFARIDIKSNSEGKCHFMEVNLVPGMTLGSSYFPEACRIELGLSYDQIIAHLIEYCLTKSLKTEQYTRACPAYQAELSVGEDRMNIGYSTSNFMVKEHDYS